jgi:hypothetical protein
MFGSEEPHDAETLGDHLDDSRSSDDNLKLAIDLDKTDFHFYPVVGIN